MAFEAEDKQEVLESLIAARRHGQVIELSLKFQGKTAEAEDVRKATDRLSTQIDALLGEMMEDWVGRADQTIKKLTTANAKLETAAGAIKKQVKVAQNVVKAVGFLDDAVAIAKKVLAMV